MYLAGYEQVRFNRDKQQRTHPPHLIFILLIGINTKQISTIKQHQNFHQQCHLQHHHQPPPLRPNHHHFGSWKVMNCRQIKMKMVATQMELKLLHVTLKNLKLKYPRINWLSLLETVWSRMLMDTFSKDA